MAPLLASSRSLWRGAMSATSTGCPFTRAVWGVGYYAAGIVVTSLLLKGVRASTTAASSSGGEITRYGVSSNGRFAESVSHNGVVYTSGQVGKGPSIEDATKAALADIDHALSLAGTDKTRVLSVNVYLKNISRDYRGMNAEYDKWLAPGSSPCRATVEANLADPGWVVEISCIAATK